MYKCPRHRVVLQTKWVTVNDRPYSVYFCPVTGCNYVKPIKWATKFPKRTARPQPKDG